MEIASITRIIQFKNEIKEKISSIDKNAHSGSTFGSESEYTYKGLISGVDSLLTDITTLTKSPQQFLKLSTYNERQNIINALSHISSYLNDPSTLISYLDTLKTAIRPFHIRYTKERLLDFDAELSELVRKKSQFEEELAGLSKAKRQISKEIEAYIKIKKEIEDLNANFHSEYDETIDKYGLLITLIDKANNSVTDTNNLITKSESNFNSIADTLNRSKELYSKIETFSNGIDSASDKMKLINIHSNEFEQKMHGYDITINDLKVKALDLINNAIEALGYSTAKGLSASFQTQINKIKKSWYWSWLIGSGIFLAATVGVGIWIIIDVKPDNSSLWANIIGRLAITPFTIAGAIFCANQYIRTKNILDDYSYKLVIAQSIVGFSEQLKDSTTSSEEYKDYIRLALEQIHQDPLRKRPKVSKDVDGGIKNGIDYVLETAQKVVNLTKPGEK
ncbi:hypothetical protein [uncultured Acetobacteroides sp.]|uniref:hypothetical protein n=1 Tax=uncultured Acetobacteroides sp. TaxID=1760811 RepID=UPI0029F562F5|nr:hypothetical protein [uncultured Acetobacteroides sp.]